MSMTTSMLVSDASPNASMDVEATTVKFRQASLEEGSAPATPNLPNASSVVSLGIAPVTSTMTNVPIGLTTPAPSKGHSAFPQDQLSDKSKQGDSNLFRYFNNKTASPFDNINSPAASGGNGDSAMMNPVYMSPTDNFNISNAIPSPDSFLTPATEQDVFTASLLSSDADRRHDAWIPAENTKQALITMATSPPGTYFPEKELLTMPVTNCLWSRRGKSWSSQQTHSAFHSVECQYFGDLDAPDLYFEFYPELYGGRKGSMVPFGFRLLVAELPQYLGKHTQALDRLCALERTCDQIIANLNNGLSEDGSNLEMSTNMRDDSLKLWKTRRLRVTYSLSNGAVSLKDFRLACGLLEQLIEEDPNSAAGLYSALGRLCLQLGDVSAAQEAFNQYLEHTPPPPNHDPVQGLLHSAYVSIAQNAFKDAAEILQQAHKINSNNGLVINNLGVCLMYTGRVSDAIKLVEGAVFSQPDRFLHEAVVLNLATMYELESSNAHQNKLKLLSLIAQHKGDSFNVAALKLQPQ
ncbi:Trafficking protein particle complex subunit 12 [Halocaridina rubra]|uniref:Trafficking protein particle complex subunit 12 n=1 Tax=Halocaridina rubra TaxID=373956 RepID=A0AAN9AGI1_HALRR